MCHLAVEKALKGLWQQRHGSPPPRTHNLVRLVDEAGLTPDERIARLLTMLAEASVATRYPPDLAAVESEYRSDKVQDLLAGATEALEWLRSQFSAS